MPPTRSVPTLPPAQATPATPATPATTTLSGSVDWLGMQIDTVAPGVAVIETVKLGSAGDQAGLEPGDAILAVNSRPIHGALGIAAAVRGLAAGQRVQLQIAHGSALDTTEATLAAPPIVHP